MWVPAVPGAHRLPGAAQTPKVSAEVTLGYYCPQAEKLWPRGGKWLRQPKSPPPGSAPCGTGELNAGTLPLVQPNLAPQLSGHWSAICGCDWFILSRLPGGQVDIPMCLTLPKGSEDFLGTPP